MATIGTVTNHEDGHYEGELRTLSVRADITIMPVSDKASHNQPDFRVLSKGVEIGVVFLDADDEWGPGVRLRGKRKD